MSNSTIGHLIEMELQPDRFNAIMFLSVASPFENRNAALTVVEFEHEPQLIAQFSHDGPRMDKQT